MKPILLDLPKLILTPRLILRGPQPGDGAILNASVKESWDHLAPFMPFASGEKPSLESSEELVRKSSAKWILREDFWIFIFDRKTNEHIGCTGLHMIEWDIPALKIGFWVRSSKEGKGYITESTNALTRFAFDYLKCKRVEIRCNSKNLKSKSVMERLKFPLEGVMKEYCSGAKGGGDTLLFARTDKSELPDLDVCWEF